MRTKQQNLGRSRLLFYIVIFGLLLLAPLFSSCSAKYGCPINEEAGPKVDKEGNFSMKRGKTKLFKN